MDEMDEMDERLVLGSMGKVIVAAAIGRGEYKEDGMVLQFTDGSGLRIYDGGQSSCEKRYMSCDDNLPYFTGSTFMSAEVREAPAVEDEDGGVHEVEFLVLHTSKGVITVANHNEHNGWYSGFWMRAEPLAGDVR